jgi:hypothetical protein
MHTTVNPSGARVYDHQLSRFSLTTAVLYTRAHGSRPYPKAMTSKRSNCGGVEEWGTRRLGDSARWTTMKSWGCQRDEPPLPRGKARGVKYPLPDVFHSVVLPIVMAAILGIVSC